MKKTLLLCTAVVLITSAPVLAQMGTGMGSGPMMGVPPQAPAPPPQGNQPLPGETGYGMPPWMTPGYGMVSMRPGGCGAHYPAPGYGMGHMQPGMMPGYGMPPWMMPGYGMEHMSPWMMPGYGMGHMSPGKMPGYGMQPGMMGSGSGQAAPGYGADLERQRAFLKATAEDRRKLHGLMFDYMEARWDLEAKPEKLEGIGKQIQELQKRIYEKSRE